ncbi:hypothetical protein [Halomarina ordinaria]|uniref:Uncharacterized protein n=1 Tax=Halomarina ordinaria TaxID=3033939 RepID=A0ABD5U542_9EURY|nr:hypothetical protein [Halomarina sp. PSRA2]
MSYDLRPTERELSEARALVTVALDACERELTLDGPLSVALGWSDSAAVTEAFGGVDGTCYPEREVQLSFNAGVEGWADAVGPTAARLYGEAWLRERIEHASFRWQHLLVRAAGERLADRTDPDGPRPWREADAQTLTERWTALSESLGSSEPLVVDRALGGVAAAVGEELVERQGFEGLAECTRSDVLAAGEAALR